MREHYEFSKMKGEKNPYYLSKTAVNKTQVVTLRLPADLKSRLDLQAKLQGVPLNNLANYLLTSQIGQLETLSVVEQHLRGKDIKTLKSNVAAILDKVPHKAEVPEWDRL